MPLWSLLLLVNTCTGVLGNLCSQWTNASYFDGYCYFLSKTTATYDEAKSNCSKMFQGNDVGLAEPRTESQFKFLQEQARNLNLSTKNGTGVLMAATRDNDTMKLVWSRGQEVTNWWSSGKPDDHNFEEDCLEMRIEYEFWLNDVPCFRPNYYSCQKYIGDLCDSVLQDSDFYNGYCIKLYNTFSNWSSSVAACEKDGGYLAEPTTMSMLRFLLLLLRITPGQSSTDVYYLGASSVNGTFRWLTTEEPIALDYWATGEPSNGLTKLLEDKLAITKQSMKLSDVESRLSAKFFCQKKAFIHRYVIVVPSRLLHLSAQLMIANSNEENIASYVIQQHMANTDICNTYEDLYIEVRTDLEPIKCINLDSRLGINSSGVSEQYVMVRSSHPLTVVLRTMQDTFNFAATLILPVALFSQNYYLLSLPQSTGQVSVTAVYNNTDVTLKVPLAGRKNVILDIDKVSVRQPGYATFTLNKFQTVLINTSSLASAFIYATKDIAVNSFIEKVVVEDVTYSDMSMDMLIPVEFMTSEYIVFPSWPLSDTPEKYRLLAVYDNTNVVVYGPKTETFVLSKSGDSDELSLPGSTFFYMKSDAPFQASKMLFGTTSGTCVTPLLPSTLWLTEYVFFTQPSSTVEFPVAAIIFLITELPQFLLTYNITEQCLNIEGTSMSGCYFKMPAGAQGPVYISNKGVKFAAYVAWITEKKMYTCYPLNVNASSKYNVSFDGLKNINFDETSCDTETESKFTTVENKDSSEVESSSSNVPVTCNLSTDPDEGSLSTVLNEGEPSTVLATEDKSSTVPTEISSSDLFTLTVPDAISTFWSSQLTTRQIDYNELYHILQELEMNYKNTSTFRRTKTSAPDLRVSSTVIGLSGVAILIVFFVLFIFSDVIYFFRYLASKCQS